MNNSVINFGFNYDCVKDSLVTLVRTGLKLKSVASIKKLKKSK
jgi:hypothetical protein